MARKRQIKVPPSIVKALIIFLIAGVVMTGIYFSLVHAFVNADIFKVKMIKIESALSFIQYRDIGSIRGKSIFKVNLKDIQANLTAKYPQMAEIRIIKEYPDQISIEAKKRLPFAQILVRNRVVILDQKGVVLSESLKSDDRLPFINGMKGNYFRIGLPIRGPQMACALEILRYYRIEKSLTAFPLTSIHVLNLSEVFLTLNSNLIIKVDKDHVEQKIKLLGFMLSRGDLELSQIKYIDLRFKEPVLGKNDVLNKKGM